MSTPDRLMGVGQSPEVAKRVGFFIASAANGTGADARTLNGPGNILIVVSNASASIVLGSQFDIGDEVYVIAHTGVSLYPASDSFIWPTSAGVARAVTSGVNKSLIKTSQLVWEIFATA